MKNCLKCDFEIESDDNFCPNCGHYTTHGLSYFYNNGEKISELEGKVNKKDDRVLILGETLIIIILIILSLFLIRGIDIFKPIFYIQKEILKFNTGYNNTILKTNNYYNKEINNYDEALDLIKNDLNNQKWKCSNQKELYNIENIISKKNNILSVDLCDMNINDANKIKEVINKMYELFPNNKLLTNISISNDLDKNVVAYFEPNRKISKNVNKTQILINSYYFLNDNNIEDNWYVKDATKYSLLAHELGHFLVYSIALKENNLDNNILNSNEINSNLISENIVNKVLVNLNEDIEILAKNISNYALDKLDYNEIIAEAVHDYYLHLENAKIESLEIIKILKGELYD